LYYRALSIFAYCISEGDEEESGMGAPDIDVHFQART
jgi:hypothetical protein